MKRILKDLQILQEKKVPKGTPGYYTVYERLNPYNPLSYIILTVFIVVSIVLYGLVGAYHDLSRNPFNWR